MSNLLVWRNPQGREEGWFNNGDQGVGNAWKLAGKVITVEIGLCILTTMSVVETVAYSVFALGSLAFYPITNRPCKFFASLLQSSSFTVIWGIADALIYNPFFANVLTHESFARYWADKLNPTPIVLFRLDDRLHVADWEQQNFRRPGIIGQRIDNPLVRPIILQGQATQQAIEQGSRFITTEVLHGATPATLSLFEDMDPSIYMFVLAKAVFIYTVGSKKNELIPDFFKPATKVGITALRRELNTREIQEQLESCFVNLGSFERGVAGDVAKKAFNQLRSVASGELQNSLFVTRCWQKACEALRPT